MLTTEIEQSQRLVRTDAYQMSIGEIINMFKDGDLVINPDFQRLFRWTSSQKSKLIESILLGIPLPPIFIFEKQDGKWELIDGLQRLSTVLEFMGLLVDTDTGVAKPSYLEATKYLPSLHNVVWEKSDLIDDLSVDDQVALDKVHQLTIRRARLGVEILKRPSDNQTKFDLFQRLNSAGTPANPQELRNCVMIMVNPDYYRAVKLLAEQESFQHVVAVNDEQIERQKHLEYASRFMAHMFVPYDGRLDVEDFIDTATVDLATAGMSPDKQHVFSSTFELLDRVYGGGALRRIGQGGHTGRIGLAAFESIAIGVGKNIDAILALPDPNAFITARITAYWQSDEANRFTAGMRGTTRIQQTIPFGEAWFRP